VDGCCGHHVYRVLIGTPRITFLQQPLIIMKERLQKTTQETEEDYLAKIERAKKLLALYNDITFGDDISAVKSRIVLNNLQ